MAGELKAPSLSSSLRISTSLTSSNSPSSMEIGRFPTSCAKREVSRR